MLLNIPPQKTLLRRHLTTKFNALIGPEAEQEKREKMTSPAYTPLTTTAKVRVSGNTFCGSRVALLLPSCQPRACTWTRSSLSAAVVLLLAC